MFAITAMAAGLVATSCSNMEESVMPTQQDSQVSTRAVGNKTPKLTVYLETNDVNPLNAGEYYFTGTNPQEQVIDHVILFASNIRGTINSVQLYHNANQSYILSHRSTLIAPLQQKGIKVLLGLLGDHTGIGFSNLTPPMINSFAQQIADCVNNNNLDGVDFDDEFAEYGRISGTLLPNSTIYGNLIQKVRQLLPGKLVTAFNYSETGDTAFNQATYNALNYMWPNFGTDYTAPTNLGNSKYAKMSIHIISQSEIYPGGNDVQLCANNYTGYGAIMLFNLCEWDTSGIMNNFSSRVWNGKTVSWTGNSYLKNY